MSDGVTFLRQAYTVHSEVQKSERADCTMPRPTEEKLHSLDLGVARFTEFWTTVILTEWINADYYKEKLRELATAWPVIMTRMTRRRTKLTYSTRERLDTMWSHKTVSSTLAAKLPEFAADDLPLSIDYSRLDDYFKLPAFGTIPTRITKPAVLRLQVVQFKDAAVLKFTVQHPLCDAKGLYKIITAYCDLLAGNPIPSLNPRTQLELVHEDKLSADDDSDDTSNAEELESETQADNVYSKGWGSFLKSGVAQWSRKAVREARVPKAVLIPLPVMMHWRHVAETMNVKVSRNDLLMAWLYMCSVPKAGGSPLKFTFVLNVEKALNVSGDLHNTWCLVPVQKIPEVVLDRIRLAPNQIDTLILLARCFREVIENARKPSFVQQTMKAHTDVSVVSPKDFGRSEPNVRVSSWSYVDLWALQFSSGPLPFGMPARTIKPRWVSGNIDFCPALDWANLTCDDTLVTWNEPRGYWVQGRLHQEIWERIVQSSAVVLLDQRTF